MTHIICICFCTNQWIYFDLFVYFNRRSKQTFEHERFKRIFLRKTFMDNFKHNCMHAK